MKLNKRPSLVLIFAFTFLALLARTVLAVGTNVDFLSNLEPLKEFKFISTPEFTHQPLYDAFDNAKKSIKVGIFGISSPIIAQHLIDAQKRGVNVTVICDSYCTKSPGKQQIVDQLKSSGAQVFIASAGFSISHWKMFVVDDQMAFISTMNFITRANQMRDMGIFLTNPTILAEILTVFNQDIENSKNQTAITPELTQPNLVWSPVNSEVKLVSLINSAKTTIDIWIENMGEKTVHEALKTAVARKVTVRILTSLCGLGMPPSVQYAVLKELSAAGIDVKGEPYPANSEIPYIHAKSISVDQKTIFFGSENFSYNSLLKARELGLIFEEPGIAAQMHDLYEKDWSHAQAFPDQAPDRCSALQDTPVPPAAPASALK